MEHGPRGLDRLQEVRVPDRLELDHVDGPAEELLEGFEETEVAIRSMPHLRRVELHEEVQVACLRVEVVSCG